MKTRSESLLMSAELRAHASIQRKANCPRTYYSGVNCPREESWGRDSYSRSGQLTPK